jgi:hypothetical protein
MTPFKTHPHLHRFALLLLIMLMLTVPLSAQDPEATAPTEPPTVAPIEPTAEPTTEMPPTLPPTAEPSPTQPPTEAPTQVPTEAPTELPTEVPTEAPSPTPDEITLTPELTPTPNIDPVTGKSLDLVIVNLGIEALAAQDLFINAHPITALPFTDADETTGSGVEPNEPVPTCGFNITSTVWYAFTPPTPGRYIISTQGSSFDTMLAAYTGPSLEALSEIACNDDATRNELTAALNLTLTSTDTVYIQLGGYNGNYGPYQISVQAVGVPIPQPARQLLPTNNTLTNNDQVTLQWGPPLRGVLPDYYRVQVATDARFINLYADQIIPAAETTLTLNAPPDGLYFWRVAALNINQQESRFTAAWRFTLDTTPPDAPALSAPAHESAIPQVRPRLTWLRSLTANRYRVEIADNPAFTNAHTLESAANAVVLSAALMPEPLAQGTYYWRVAARDAALNWSEPSPAATFAVNLSNTPANNQVYVAPVRTGVANVTLTWLANGIRGAQYTVELATDSAFTNIVATSPTIPQLRYAFTGLEPNIYFWRVLVDGSTPPPESSVRSFSISPPAPPRLVPTAPANNSLTNTPDQVLLSWNGTDPDLNGGPFTYELQIGTNARFPVNTFTTYATDLHSFAPQSATLSDGVYFWRVRSINRYNSPGAWSVVWRFTVDTTPPVAPVLATPLNQASTNVSQPTLVWRPAATANYYRVEVSTSPTFDGPLLYEQKGAARQLRLPVPLTQGVYYWRVSPRDAAGNWGPFSEVFSFAFGLQAAPANNLFSVSRRPVFTWGVLPTAQRYRLQVYEQNDPATPYLEVVTPDQRVRSHRLTSDLPYGTYHWNVDVDNGAGWEESPVNWTFTITPRALARPALTGPRTNTFTNETMPLFTWNNVTDPDGNPVRYEVNISNNARFTTLATGDPVIVNEAEFTPSIPLSDGRYFWRVRAINAYDGPGAWSANYVINIDTLAPPVPVIRSPLNATVTLNPRQPFVWNPAVGAQRYEIRLGVQNPPETLISTNAARQYVPAAPLLYTTYYWQVRALDAAGNISEWSPVQTVKIEANTNQRITLNRFDTPTPTLSWSPVSWATAYELAVASDTRFVNLQYQDNTLTPQTHSHTLTAPLANGTYYWRVRAQRPNGAWSAWSTVGTFTVEQ